MFDWACRRLSVPPPRRGGVFALIASYVLSRTLVPVGQLPAAQQAHAAHHDADGNPVLALPSPAESLSDSQQASSAASRASAASNGGLSVSVCTPRQADRRVRWASPSSQFALALISDRTSSRASMAADQDACAGADRYTDRVAPISGPEVRRDPGHHVECDECDLTQHAELSCRLNNFRRQALGNTYCEHGAHTSHGLDAGQPGCANRGSWRWQQGGASSPSTRPRFGDSVEVTAGLAPQDQVIDSPPSHCQSGDRFSWRPRHRRRLDTARVVVGGDQRN